jgi:hypothetical protein
MTRTRVWSRLLTVPARLPFGATSCLRARSEEFRCTPAPAPAMADVYNRNPLPRVRCATCWASPGHSTLGTRHQPDALRPARRAKPKGRLASCYTAHCSSREWGRTRWGNRAARSSAEKGAAALREVMGESIPLTAVLRASMVKLRMGQLLYHLCRSRIPCRTAISASIEAARGLTHGW